MLVGEAPGPSELKSGVPFSGGSGQLLEHAMSRAGLSMSECFQTNVAHVPAPDQNFNKFYQKQHQLAYLQGVLQLKRDIESVKPYIIVCLGSGALKAVTGKDGIDKWRGSLLESTLSKGVKCIGTFNPAYALRVYEAKAIIEMDMLRVKDESSSPELVLPHREHILHPDEPTRERIVDEMLRAEWLSVDIECWLDDAAGRWKLACVGFSDRPDRSLVIHNDSESARHAIRRLVDSPIKKIYQNGMFDVTVLRQEGYECPNFAWDTMFAHHSLFMEAARGEDEISKLKGKKKLAVFKKGLGFQASIYTREPFYKDDGKLWKESGDLSLFWLYNGRDAAVTHEIKQVQDNELDQFGVRRAFERQMRAAEPLMSATRRGIRIDLDVRNALRTKYESELANLQSFLDGQAGRPINVKGKDINWLLYEKLKLPVKYNKKTGNEAADKFVLQELGHKYNHPMLMTVLAIRERRDYLEKYINVPISPDGRIRCSFDLTGTQSGRLSSRASLDGSGTNLQNIPARKKVGELVKRMFIADEGKVFVYRDFSQAEAWLVAYLARCEGLIELLNDPTRDIHKENAARIFNVPISEVTSEQRYLAKRVIHASNYGMGGDKLVLIVNEDAETTGVRINRQKADELIQKYFMIYPEIKQNFWHEVEREVRFSRTLQSPMGCKRAFFGRMDDALIRDAYSWIPQSTVGTLGIEALSNCYYDIELGRPELGAELLLNVHDSILMQCNDDAESINATAKAMAEAMRIPLTVDGRTFTIPSDCKIGRNWAKKADDNIVGLRDIDKSWEGIYDVAA